MPQERAVEHEVPDRKGNRWVYPLKVALHCEVEGKMAREELRAEAEVGMERAFGIQTKKTREVAASLETQRGLMEGLSDECKAAQSRPDPRQFTHAHSTDVCAAFSHLHSLPR